MADKEGSDSISLSIESKHNFASGRLLKTKWWRIAELAANAGEHDLAIRLLMQWKVLKQSMTDMEGTVLVTRGSSEQQLSERRNQLMARVL